MGEDHPLHQPWDEQYRLIDECDSEDSLAGDDIGDEASQDEKREYPTRCGPSLHHTVEAGNLLEADGSPTAAPAQVI